MTRPLTRALPVLAAAALLAGCALSRGPQTLAERTAHTQQRLDAAVTPDARRDVAARLIAGAGLSPLAGLRGTGARYTAGRLLGGFVPGRSYGLRDTLVVVAAAIDGPHAATLVETARLLTARADSRGDMPERSVLVVLWEAGLSTTDGLASVRSFSLWPRDAVRLTLVLADGLAADALLTDAGHPVAVFQTAGLPAATNAADLFTTVLLAAAASPLD